MPKEIKLTFEPLAEANLRKLARALIALAQQKMEQEQAETDSASQKGAA